MDAYRQMANEFDYFVLSIPGEMDKRLETKSQNSQPNRKFEEVPP